MFKKPKTKDEPQPKVVVCEKCENNNPEGATVCRNCGEELIVTAKEDSIGGGEALAEPPVPPRDMSTERSQAERFLEGLDADEIRRMRNWALTSKTDAKNDLEQYQLERDEAQEEMDEATDRLNIANAVIKATNNME